MSSVNPSNERLKRRYFVHMREAKGLADKTIDHASRAIAAFEQHTHWKAFDRFNQKDAIAFKRALMMSGGKRSAELSSRATIYSKLNHLETFFTWVAEQPGFKSKLRIADSHYFRLPRRDARLAHERPEKPAPSLEQIQTVIRSMPASGDVELRNRGLMAFLILTGARVNAVRTFKLKHLRRDGLGIIQDATEVRTKGSKTFPTFYFPVGDDLRDIFIGYVERLRELDFGPTDPLFPSSKQSGQVGTMSAVVGLQAKHWETADPVRAICKRAFEAAGTIYFSPHTFRRTLVLLAEERCRTPAELKAWSQNLGHDKVLTTLTSYGALPESRQAELVTALVARPTEVASPKMRQLMKALIAQMDEEGRESDSQIVGEETE